MNKWNMYIEGFSNTVRILSYCDCLSLKQYETNYKLVKVIMWIMMNSHVQVDWNLDIVLCTLIKYFKESR